MEGLQQKAANLFQIVLPTTVFHLGKRSLALRQAFPVSLFQLTV
jgi:hypothetical protein